MLKLRGGKKFSGGKTFLRGAKCPPCTPLKNPVTSAKNFFPHENWHLRWNLKYGAVLFMLIKVNALKDPGWSFAIDFFNSEVPTRMDGAFSQRIIVFFLQTFCVKIFLSKFLLWFLYFCFVRKHFVYLRIFLLPEVIVMLHRMCVCVRYRHAGSYAVNWTVSCTRFLCYQYVHKVQEHKLLFFLKFAF